jgi:hypothetical protein
MIAKEKSGAKIMAFATYKAKPGKHAELLALVKRHVPVLRELGLISDKGTYLAVSEDQTIVEVFEWISTNAIRAAHQHPAMTDLWEKMSVIAEFPPMSALKESKKPFPGFETIN